MWNIAPSKITTKIEPVTLVSKLTSNKIPPMRSANAIVIIGMGIGVGLQVFLSEKSKTLGCKLDVKKKAFGGNIGSTATSFFSLVPLGCCGCMHHPYYLVLLELEFLQY